MEFNETIQAITWLIMGVWGMLFVAIFAPKIWTLFIAAEAISR